MTFFAASACVTACSDGRADADFEGATSAALQPEAAAEWSAIAESAGAGRLKDKKLIVLGVRGLDHHGRVHDTVAAHQFDDVWIVLRFDEPSLILEASTHPFEKQGTRGVPDVDHDGTSDVGMVRPGLYWAKSTTDKIDQAPVFWVNLADDGDSDKLPAWRDTNQDGVVSAEERAFSEAHKHTIDEVLFHVASDDAPKAVGCQVSTRGALRLLHDVAPRGFEYVLIDARTLESVPPLE